MEAEGAGMTQDQMLLDELAVLSTLIFTVARLRTARANCVYDEDCGLNTFLLSSATHLSIYRGTFVLCRPITDEDWALRIPALFKSRRRSPFAGNCYVLSN